MSKNYFFKDKVLEIYKQQITRDGMGGVKTTFVPLEGNPLWCYASQIKQDVFFSARAYEILERYFWVVNYNPEIAVKDFVLYRGRWYEITRVDTEDDYNGEMFVYGKDAVAPKASEIL